MKKFFFAFMVMVLALTSCSDKPTNQVPATDVNSRDAAVTETGDETETAPDSVDKKTDEIVTNAPDAELSFDDTVSVDEEYIITETAVKPGNASSIQLLPSTEEYVSKNFADLFEAKKTLLNEEETELSMSFYTEESYNRYSKYISEMNAVINSDAFTLEAADSMYSRIKTEKSKLELVKSDIDTVYINTNKKGIGWDYTKCSVAVIPSQTSEYKYVYSSSCEIRLRGNSTAGAEKKPYNIRFEEKVSLCGMDSGKRWVLLANAFDKSLMRNNIAFYTAAAFNLPYTSQATFVDVYLNGEYVGNYCLCEPVTDGNGRVDIDKEKNDFIIELDMNRNDGSKYIEPEIGRRFKISRPETPTKEQVSYLKQFIKDMEASLKTHDMGEYSKYLDVESFVNFYCFCELTKNIDGYDFSTRYHIKDGKLYAGPTWDSDLSMGNVNPAIVEEKYWIYNNANGYGDGSSDSAYSLFFDNFWFHELLQDTKFKNMVKDKYLEYQPIIQNLYMENELGISVIDSYIDTYGASFTRNYERWSFKHAESGYTKKVGESYLSEITYLKNWLQRRNEYLLKELCGQ